MKCVEDSAMCTETHLSFRHKYRQKTKREKDSSFSQTEHMKTIEEVMKQKRTDGTDIRQQAGSYASLSSPMEAQNCDDKVAAAKRT